MECIAGENGFPIVGRLVGRLLFILTKLEDLSLIVELGSGFGYSASWFAYEFTRAGDKNSKISLRLSNTSLSRSSQVA